MAIFTANATGALPLVGEAYPFRAEDRFLLTFDNHNLVNGNEIRAARDLPTLPKVTPHALRRTYISLMLEAGAPLPYVMDQVGHQDSKTTLEIYAHVQKRISRTKVHLAFDELLASAAEARHAAGPDLR